jgi:hypothetical protein
VKGRSERQQLIKTCNHQHTIARGRPLSDSSNTRASPSASRTKREIRSEDLLTPAKGRYLPNSRKMSPIARRHDVAMRRKRVNGLDTPEVAAVCLDAFDPTLHRPHHYLLADAKQRNNPLLQCERTSTRSRVQNQARHHMHWCSPMQSVSLLPLHFTQHSCSITNHNINQAQRPGVVQCTQKRKEFAC